jgi:hypothetical protein
MGDKFYELFRAAHGYVTIEKGESEASVHIVFADEE